MRHINLICIPVSVFALVLFGLYQSATAEIVRYSFAGEFTQVFDNVNRNFSRAEVLDTEIRIRDTFSGWVDIEFDSTPVANSGGTRYFQNSPTAYMVDINGITISNDGNFAVVVRNEDPGGTDAFGFTEGWIDSPFINPIAGTTVLMNGDPMTWGRIIVDVIDESGDALDSDALPNDIVISDYNLKRFSLSGRYGAGFQFSLDENCSFSPPRLSLSLQVLP